MYYFCGMNQEEFQLLTDEHIFEIISAHANEDPSTFALSWADRKDLPVRAIAEQISCRQKAREKIPSLSDYPLIYEPVALQQASSEATARFKSSLLSGNRLIDLTGGMGIDTLFISSSFAETHYCELDTLRSAIFAFNCKQLNRSDIIVHNNDGTSVLERYPDMYFDWIYIDPSRRDRQGRRTITIERYQPDITNLIELFFRKAKNICIKMAPAVEFAEVNKVLSGIHRGIYNSVNNECRELLLIGSHDAEKQQLTIEAVLLDSNGKPLFQVHKERDTSIDRTPLSDICRYFYEPDAAIRRARLAPQVAHRYEMAFINPTVDYLTSNQPVHGFPGRAFTVIAAIPWQRRNVSSYLKDRSITYANVARRDFPLPVEQIKTMLSLKDGGDDYLFFTKDSHCKRIFIHCRKL